ncbi:MAG: adenylate/guanylate cyclase domain-containing protein [Actinomycetota bacterium]
MSDPIDRRNADRNPSLDEPTGEILVPLVAADTGPAREWADAAREDAVASPDEIHHGTVHLNVTRTFLFADLSGFTAYTRTHGPHAAVEALGEFRRVTRDVAARRGVRVAKWLGDGVMLVGTDATPTVAAGAHLMHHFEHNPIDVRVGLATGIALLFEGDDYIGEPVNLAAKLCAAAQPNEMLAVCEDDQLPSWVKAEGGVSVKIKGVGSVGGIHRLTLDL